LEEGKVLDLDGKMWPDASDTDASSHYKVPFSRTVYIEKTDFRLKDSKDYYGLAPGKSVMLRYPLFFFEKVDLDLLAYLLHLFTVI
jgi:glutaminyl-tRNA synthetase